MTENGGETRVALSLCGQVDPFRIDSYLERGGYAALRRAVCERSPTDIVAEIERAGLRGRGGAGFPTAAKWQAVAAAEADVKYAVANAYDADPAAPIGQTLLEQNPHRILEGLVLAAYAVGASEGFIYVGAGKSRAWESLRTAIGQAYADGLLGARIAGSRFSFEVRPVRSWGGFVGGEETAALAAIEGRRAMPEQKPPYPAIHGLLGKPTLVNSAETLVNVPWILEQGAEAFGELGTERARGTKVVSLSGRVRHRGMVEVEMGATLRTLVGVLGGGEPEGPSLKAILVGGPTGGFLPESLWNTPLEYEALTEAGAVMGSGSIVAIDRGSCMVDLARSSLSYLAGEACGKCVP